MPFPDILDTLKGAALSPRLATPAFGDAGIVNEDATGVFNTIANTPSSAWYKEQQFDADQEAIIALGVYPASTGNCQLWVRGQGPGGGASSGYFLRFNPTGTIFELRKKIGGGASTLILAGALALVVTDTIRIRAQGQTITSWRKATTDSDFVLVGTVQDGSITGPGYIGFTVVDSTGTVTRLVNLGGGHVPGLKSWIRRRARRSRR